MSMDLYLWKGPVTDDPDEARKLIDRYFDKQAGVFEPSTDIAAVADELRRLYPYWPISGEELLASMSEAEKSQYKPEGLAELRASGSFRSPEDSPWADLPFEQSDNLLQLSIRWSADDKALDDIVRLAREHRLVLYDPQGPHVQLPDDPVDNDEVMPPTAWEWLKLTAIAAFLCAVTWAAWQIPIGWIRWPAVIVAGFVAAAGLFALGAGIVGALGIIDPDEGRTTCQKGEPPL